MNGSTPSLDKVSENIVDTIIADKIFQKEKILPRVRSILKVWYNSMTRPADYDSIKTDKGLLQKTIEHRGVERDFWRLKITELVGKDKMQPYYDEINNLLKEKGFTK